MAKVPVRMLGTHEKYGYACRVRIKSTGTPIGYAWYVRWVRSEHGACGGYSHGMRVGQPWICIGYARCVCRVHIDTRV